MGETSVDILIGKHDFRREPNGEWLSIEPNLLDTWDVEHATPRDGTTLLNRAETLPGALETADRFVIAQRPDAARQINKL